MISKLNPALIARLKQTLGNELMSTEEALQRYLKIAMENRGLKSPLHVAVVEAMRLETRGGK